MWAYVMLSKSAQKLEEFNSEADPQPLSPQRYAQYGIIDTFGNEKLFSETKSSSKELIFESL